MQDPLLAVMLLVVAGVLLVVIAAPFIIANRLSPGYKEAREKEAIEEQRAAQTSIDYAVAGYSVRESFVYTLEATGTHAGMAFKQGISRATRASPSEATVIVASALAGDFIATRKSPGDSLAKLAGMDAETRTGDEAFDREFLLESSSRDYVQTLFADARNRDAVRALFALGMEGVELSGGKLSARKTRVELRPLDLALVNGTVEQLAKIHVPAGLAGVVPAGGASLRLVRAVLYSGMAVAAAFVAWAVVGTRPLTDGWLMVASLEWPTFALAGVVLAAAAAAAMRGWTGAHREIPSLGIGLLVIVCGGWCASIVANEKLDASGPVIRNAWIHGSYKATITRGNCNLVLESWRADVKEVTVQVPCDAYRAFPQGKRVAVATHAGRFGIEWIESVNGAPAYFW